MIFHSLKDRVFSYEDISNFKLTRKLPVIISLNGRSFRKTTSLLEKPFCKQFASLIGQTLIKLASEVEGSVFLYSFNDEIIIVCRNDQTLETEAWFDNDIQRIVSATSSIASMALHSAATTSNIKLLGDPIFLAKSFIVPSWTEAINYLIAKQHAASHTAISMACFYELLKKYNADRVVKIMKNLTIEDKYDLLVKECDMDLQLYDLAFWRGMAAYRDDRIIKNNLDEPITKKKLIVDSKLPFFSKNQDFLKKILLDR